MMSGIGLFTRRTTRDPDPQLGAVFALAEKIRKRGLERPEGFRIAEEAADSDQPITPEGIDLVAALFEKTRVRLHAVDAVEMHSPLDAPNQRPVLVLGEIAASAMTHDRQDPIELLGRYLGRGVRARS